MLLTLKQIIGSGPSGTSSFLFCLVFSVPALKDDFKHILELGGLLGGIGTNYVPQ